MAGEWKIGGLISRSLPVNRGPIPRSLAEISLKSFPNACFAKPNAPATTLAGVLDIAPSGIGRICVAAGRAGEGRLTEEQRSLRPASEAVASCPEADLRDHPYDRKGRVESCLCAAAGWMNQLRRR